MCELEKMLAPPTPPEPEPIEEDEPGSRLGDPDFNVEAWSRHRRRCW
jgi:hypothetical protein